MGSQERIEDLCSKIKHDKDKFFDQQYRESIMVPTFVSQASPMFDEEKLRAHVEKGRKYVSIKNEIVDVMTCHGNGGFSPVAQRGDSSGSKSRKAVTGKIGNSVEAVRAPDTD